MYSPRRLVTCVALLAGAGALVLAGAATSSATTSNGAKSATFAISATTITAGGVITISGAGCTTTGATPATVTIDVVNKSGDPVLDHTQDVAQAVFASNAAGTWSKQLTVSAKAALGTYDVLVSCDPHTSSAFGYDGPTVTICDDGSTAPSSSASTPPTPAPSTSDCTPTPTPSGSATSATTSPSTSTSTSATTSPSTSSSASGTSASTTAAAVVATTSSSAGALAFTGSSSKSTAIIGLALLLIGGIATVGTTLALRRTRGAHH